MSMPERIEKHIDRHTLYNSLNDIVIISEQKRRFCNNNIRIIRWPGTYLFVGCEMNDEAKGNSLKKTPKTSLKTMNFHFQPNPNPCILEFL